MPSSLSARLLLSVSLVLVLFFGITVAALDRLFRETGERAMQNVLEIHLIALLAAAKGDGAGGLEMPDDLPEERFSQPGSGLFGQIRDAGGAIVWRSASSIGARLREGQLLAPGEREVVRVALFEDIPVMSLALGIEWEFADDTTRRFEFDVAESLDLYHAQVQSFRQQLFVWFLALMLLLLTSLALLLRWILQPLRRIESEIAAVEAGSRMALGDGYPSELVGVTENMNALIRDERARLQRYRNTLGNLAHSLKTPLAVMRSALQSGRPDAATLDAQIDRMDAIVGSQLRRAATSAGTTLGHTPVPVTPVVEELRGALDKVYADKQPRCLADTDRDAVFYGDREDLTDLIGNLLDNAYKWCRTTVRIAAHADAIEGRRRRGLRLVVEDDGPGIPAGDAQRVLARGARADERAEGHGIGLAVVSEIVELAGGSLATDVSALGGMRIEVRIPPR
ncbi:MAG: ATP-binding protein [Gammaproteobacteria bacterium]